ncbi:carboxymuconolactone decarboxylase family protein [Mycobacterium florentinum]|uniref:carboxymuconolactone decarboxylase family protein n=1 Tax=Mycobacterium florentinum TaxID=292462 RepID=UPI001E28AC7D|nr:carboxymuconolactone decarboxylase family protein [Mycobacterium florentinum]
MGARIDYEAAAPRGVKLLGGVHLYVSQSGLSPVLLTCVYLRVSLINGCAYCIDMHSRELRELGCRTKRSRWFRCGRRPANCSTAASAPHWHGRRPSR